MKTITSVGLCVLAMTFALELAAATENPKRFVRVELGDPCNGGRGRSAYLESTHQSRTITVKVKITARGTNNNVSTRSVSVVPGGRVVLGCTDGSGGGQPQSFSYEISRAEFVGSPNAPGAGDPRKSVKIELRQSCNGGHGRVAYVENGHNARAIKVTIKITARGTNNHVQTRVIRVPSKGSAQLGCTDGSGGGQPQSFSYEIVGAEFSN